MAKYKHLRVKEVTHNKVLMIKGLLASIGDNVPVHKLVDDIMDEKLKELEDERVQKQHDK